MRKDWCNDEDEEDDRNGEEEVRDTSCERYVPSHVKTFCPRPLRCPVAACRAS